jgi:hypothetical protein
MEFRLDTTHWPEEKSEPELQCSFCGKTETEVECLIASPAKSVYICAGCVQICHSVAEVRRPSEKGAIYVLEGTLSQ